MKKYLQKIWQKLFSKNITASHDSAEISEIREIESSSARDTEVVENEKITIKL